MKKSILKLSTFVLLLSSILFFTSCDNDPDDGVSNSDLTIVEFAQNNSDYSLLVDAVVRAELVDVLNADGPFTLFAPTNTAFQEFLNDNNFASMDDIPREVLRGVLEGHLISGEFRSSFLQTGYYATFNDLSDNSTDFGNGVFSDIYVNVSSNPNINGSANITATNIDVSNGVIHVIDEVINTPTLASFVTADPNFSILAEALTRSDLNTDFVEVLSGEGPFTVFAPSNAAFTSLLNSNEDWDTLADIPAETLEAVLLYHVTSAGNVRSTALADGQTITTLSNSETVEIDLGDGGPSVIANNNTADLIAVDLQSGNGVMHALDQVLLP